MRYPRRGVDDPGVARSIILMLTVALAVTLVPTGVGAVSQVVSIIDGNGTSKANVDNGSLRVGVSNGLGKPVPVRDFGTPVDVTVAGTISDGHSTIEGQTVFTVPAGKRLVVQTLSLLVTVPTSQRVTASNFGTNSSPGFTLAVPLQLEGSIGAGDNYSATLPVRAYVGPGSKLQLTLQRNSSTDSAPFTASMVGYLVPA